MIGDRAGRERIVPQVFLNIILDFHQAVEGIGGGILSGIAQQDPGDVFGDGSGLGDAGGGEQGIDWRNALEDVLSELERDLFQDHIEVILDIAQKGVSGRHDPAVDLLDDLIDAVDGLLYVVLQESIQILIGAFLHDAPEAIMHVRHGREKLFDLSPWLFHIFIIRRRLPHHKVTALQESIVLLKYPKHPKRNALRNEVVQRRGQKLFKQRTDHILLHGSFIPSEYECSELILHAAREKSIVSGEQSEERPA